MNPGTTPKSIADGLQRFNDYRRGLIEVEDLGYSAIEIGNLLDAAIRQIRENEQRDAPDDLK